MGDFIGVAVDGLPEVEAILKNLPKDIQDAAVDEINKYFLIKEMPVISSQYWNMVHGSSPEDVMKDEEGLQIMRTLARNMAWFLKLKEAGEKAGVKLPEHEQGVVTNFIR